VKKKIAVFAAVVSGIYLFIPEPTDAIPILGWLDEGAALGMFAWAMKSLGLSPMNIFKRAPKEPQLNA
jgi:hypothetical protein